MRNPLFEKDLHSYYVPGQPVIEHVDWQVRVDFAARVLHCTATLTFDKAGPVALDTRDLKIDYISDRNGIVMPFTLEGAVPILGSRLSFMVPDYNHTVRIDYRTSPKASGLQWMRPEQTNDKKFPFLYSQNEPNHARSMLPCQDSPGVKFTFHVDLTVPNDLRGLMAANQNRGRSANANGTAIEHWYMQYPVPAYLLAFVVGDMQYRKFSDRCGIWAEPYLIEKAARFASSLPEIMKTGERLFGDYPFGRYDLLVLPRSFPYGGMENPCLTFLNPNLVSDDGSGLRVIFHELCHSWFGNLITNARWDSFWLNEGWTTYADGRMTEAILGSDTAQLFRMLQSRAFARDCDRWYKRGNPYMAILAPNVAGTDPDDNFSSIPYFKGSMFLRKLEQMVGRKKFDAFIREYIKTFRYQSITTAEFLNYAATHLPKGTLEAVEVWSWVYEPGLPENAPVVESPLIREVVSHAKVGKLPSKATGKRWTVIQWQLYLELLPRPMTLPKLKALDARFHFSKAENPSLRFFYFLLAVESGQLSLVRSGVEQLLTTYGAITYVQKLFGALCKTASGKAQAKKIFARARSGYHPISVAMAIRAMSDAGLKIK